MFASAGTNEGDAGSQVAICLSTNRGFTWGPVLQGCPSQSTWTNIYGLVGSRGAHPEGFVQYHSNVYAVFEVTEKVTPSQRALAVLARTIAADGSMGELVRISTNAYDAIDGKAQISYSPNPFLYNFVMTYNTWGGSYDGTSPYAGWLYDGATQVLYDEPNTVSWDGGDQNFLRIWRVDGGKAGTDYWHMGENFSTNGGASWSVPVYTTIPNSPSETTLVRLTDGRFAVIGNPYDNQTDARDPLFLAITAANSNIITNVWSIRQGISGTPTYPGHSKYGGAQYPGACQVGNYLYIAYSLQKESIGFSRVLIPGLPDNNNDVWNPRVTLGISTIRSSNMRSQ